MIYETRSIRKLTTFIIVFALGFLSVSLLQTNSVNAQGLNIEVSPARSNLIVEHGSEYSQTFRIGNYSGATRKLYLYTQDFTVLDDIGTPTFLENQDPNNAQYSLTKWLTVEEEEIELQDGEVKEVDVVISIPQNAEAGGHYAAFFVQSEKPEAEGSLSIGAVGRIASLLLVNVPGDVREKVDLREFFTDKGIYFEDNPRIEFTVAMENSGSVHAIPTGVIFVSGGKNFTPKSVLINQQQGAILPNAPARTYSESFTVESRGTMPPFGKMDAKLLVKYGSQNYEINGGTTFWLIPAKFTIIAIFVLLFIIFILWRTYLSFKRDR